MSPTAVVCLQYDDSLDESPPAGEVGLRGGGVGLRGGGVGLRGGDGLRGGGVGLRE